MALDYHFWNTWCQISEFLVRSILSFGRASKTNVFAGMSVVADQAATDPNFPTVKFPNPEEKGALDLAVQTADHAGVTLILATDPDADRFAVAEKVDGKWHQFTGNQLGCLLAAHVYETYPPIRV